MRTEKDDFVELIQGEYWRALEIIPYTPIIEGDVLLLESIRDIDKQAHTIILRTHPAIYDRYVSVDWGFSESGEKKTHTTKFTEHRFLVADFLRLFTKEDNHEEIRRLEVEKIQGRISELQAEVAKGDAGSVEMRGYLANGVEEWEKKKGLEAGTSNTLVTGLVSLTPSITAQNIDDMKLAAEHKHEIATLKASWIKQRVQQITDTVNSMIPFFHEKAAAALSRTEDVRRYITKLQKSIASLDLYVGTGVVVNELKKGVSAPADIPLTIMQQRLYAEEELAVFLDVDEDFDHLSVPRFLEALTKHPKLVNQLFASERSMVAYAATRREKDYGNGFANAANNEANRRVGLLIRDGENLYAVHSPIDSHLAAHNLFPGREELDNIFLKYRGAYSAFKMDDSNINFMDTEYTDRMEAHEAFALHYKRFLILMAGLDHRLNLFGTFYNEEKSMDFISPEFQEKYFRFVHDDDGEHMLPKPNVQRIHDWIEEKNSYLKSGARVLCMWNDVMTPKTAPGVVVIDSNSREHRENWRAKATVEISMAVAHREGKDIVVNQRVTRTGWDSEGKMFDARVNLSAYSGGLAYLVLDAVTSKEMEFYIYDRETRVRHLDYMQFFKRAAKILREEEAYEAPARARLRSDLEAGGLATGEAADKVIQETVIAWRAANRGAALPMNFLGEVNQELWPSLLNQMHTILNADSHWKAAEEFAKTIDREPLRLVVTGKDRMVLYCAPKPEECDNRLLAHPWVHAVAIDRKKTGYKEKNRKWVLLPKLSASENTLYEWPGAEAWAGNSSKLTHAQKQLMFKRVDQFKMDFDDVLGPANIEAQLGQWRHRVTEISKRGYVSTPEIAFPIGVGRSRQSGEWFYICICHSDAHAVLYNYAATEELKKKIKEAYVGRYARKAHANDTFEGDIQRNWYLTTSNINAFENGHFVYGRFGEGRLPVSRSNNTASIEDHITRSRKVWSSENDHSYYCAESYILGRDTPGIKFNADEFLKVDTRSKKFAVEWHSTAPFGETPGPFDEAYTIYPLDQEGEVRSTFPVRNAFQTEHDRLIAKKTRCSSMEKARFYTLEEAREWIKDQDTVQQSTDESAINPLDPDAERWWVVQEVSDGK